MMPGQNINTQRSQSNATVVLWAFVAVVWSILLGIWFWVKWLLLTL